jgi:hypothetical protein
MSEIVKRLQAPAYWISGSNEGHEGENDAPREAADIITRLTADNEKLAEALETAGRLFAASRDENTRLTAENYLLAHDRDGCAAENEKLRALLCRVHGYPSEPECQLADDGKCPGPCVCGYFEWFEKDRALTNEIRAVLSGDKHE